MAEVVVAVEELDCREPAPATQCDEVKVEQGKIAGVDKNEEEE